MAGRRRTCVGKATRMASFASAWFFVVTISSR
jgi:hypothetical protein